MRRREFISTLPAAILFAKSGLGQSTQQDVEIAPQPGRLKQGITRGVFGNEKGKEPFTIEECCREAAKLGIKGFDFCDNPDDWPTLKKYGLVLSMYRLEYGGGLSGPRGPEGPRGWNAIGNKGEGTEPFLKAVHEGIDRAAANGFPNMLLAAGTRVGFSYEQGADNAVAFFNQVKAHAEDKGVTLCTEIVNSKGLGGPSPAVGSMFDHMSWGVGVMKRVNSPRVKILCDIFHVQLMEGDVTQTIRDNFQYIGHFHTGGVPGRHEIDETQELNYRFIAKAIADLNYTGFITHEWGPSPGKDPVATLAKVVQILNV